MKRRFTYPKAKNDELLVKYGKVSGEVDLYYCFPDNDRQMRADSKMLMIAFENTVIYKDDGRTLRKELELRGYDITTLKFSIMKKKV